MTIPTREEFRLPVLKLAAKGEIYTPECVNALADAFRLTPQERAETLRGGRTTVLANRVSWALADLGMAKLIEKTRPRWYAITDRGKALLDEEIEAIDESVLQRSPEFLRWRKGKPGEAKVKPPIESTDPVERMDADHKEIIGVLKAELLEQIRSRSPAFFERLVIDLLVKMGYGGSREDAAQAIGGSGDEGIDGVIKEDRLGLDAIYVQAKRYKPEAAVGRPEVQRFAGSLDGVGASKGVFFTTSSFTAGAREYAERVVKKIILIDGEELADLLIEHGIGVRTSAVYELKRVDEDYFVE